MPNSGWELYYTYTGDPVINHFHILMEDFEGWDGTQIITDAIYDDNAAGYELWANNPGCGKTAVCTFNPEMAKLIPFDGKRCDIYEIGCLKEWGYDSTVGRYGSITITGSTPGLAIPIKLVKKS